MSDKKKKEEAANLYPGADVYNQKDEKATAEAVREETCELNNNPRNTDDHMP